MNFGKQLLGQDEKQSQMNNTWVPITPEKLILNGSNPGSNLPVNHMRRLNYQEFPVPGSDNMQEMLPLYHRQVQNLHLMGQTGRIGEHENLSGNTANRNSVLNQIAASYNQVRHYESNGLNSNSFELLLNKNATNIASANRNLDASNNMASRNPLLPKFHPQGSSSKVNGSYAGEQSNIHSASSIVNEEANRLLIPSWNSEFMGSSEVNDSYASVQSNIHLASCIVNKEGNRLLIPSWNSELVGSREVNDSYAGVQSNIHSASGIVNKEANRLLIPSWNSELMGSSEMNDSYAGVQSNIHSASRIVNKEPNRLLIPSWNSELMGSSEVNDSYLGVQSNIHSASGIVNKEANRLLIPSWNYELMGSSEVNDSYAGVQSNIHSASGIVNIEANRLLIPSWNSELMGSSVVNDSYAGVQSNIHSASGIVNNEANRLMIPSWNSELMGSNSDRWLDNDIHCTVSNQLKGMFSDIPPGDSYLMCNLNHEPTPEADATNGFTNSIQSMPKTMDQPKLLDIQFCTRPAYTLAESTSQEKDKQEDLVSSTENEIQEYCDGLQQQIVDSSSAAISTIYEGQKGSASNTCDQGSDQGFDLNKTPENKAPKRRKHRPKVIVEAKSKNKPNSATQKTQIKEIPHKKRKNIPKSAATPRADVIEDSSDSTVATRKSCRKALNFDLQKSRFESQSRIVCQQEIHHRNEITSTTTSDYKAKEIVGGVNIKYDTDSALIISKHDELAVQNQQPRNPDDITLLWNERVNNPFLSEEQQIVKFPVTEKRPAQGNSDSHQERNNGCMQQYINAKEMGNFLFQSETYFGNSQKTGELICQNTLQLGFNILSNSFEAQGSKRKYCNSSENQHGLAKNPLGTSLCHEISQADEHFKGVILAKGFSKNKRKRTENRLRKNVCWSSSKIVSKDDSQKVRIEDNNGLQSHGDCFSSPGRQHQVYSTMTDEIFSKHNGLNLNERNISEMEGQMALVLYKGDVEGQTALVQHKGNGEQQKALVQHKGDGSIVPYQEFELAKKHRSKVDLDPETEKMWKQLMGNEGCERLEDTDKEKEKWWEEERNVFRGRVDSFIARMHLVQGDRRFSKWKGSVVDSVVGVFLTQNVSDHLSSSAFMSLAARFPLKSKSSNGSYDVVTDTLVEEPELSIVNPADDTIISYEGATLNQPSYYLDFQTPHHPRELWRHGETTRVNESLMKPNNQRSEEEFLSSQDSLDSSITQDKIITSSGSNSESDGLNSRCKPSMVQFLTSTNSLHVGKTTMFQDFYNRVNGMLLFEEKTKDGKMQQAEHMEQSSRGGRNNSHSLHSAFNHPCNFGYLQKQPHAAPSIHYQLQHPYTEGLKNFQLNGEELCCPGTVSVHSKFQENNYRRIDIWEVGDSSDKPTEMQYGNGTIGSPELPNYNQLSANHHLADQKTLQSEGRQHAESLNASQILGRGQENAINDYCNVPKHAEEGFDSEISAESRQVCSDNSRAEPNAQKLVYYPGPKDKERKLKVPKARKKKSDTEKKNAGDWDILRKEVQENEIKIERSQETMDSLDYEAIRCASVKEISDAIVSRGMNNMLAERIKAFLNRLVEEHGSIDLEWLRHVPPDKAKDYLLSIRGLGLKSVECVRLLTLHHLAFPVDTNVGRIAVRLGWVPIQPLPETLQIHLLELYPVLESVQKYLWPRLCKLDQRTLYELHYQMITFGKVFCTKKKPNCNACPLRAECRHFASAFASARLALPGPEEKQIVSMAVPITAERIPSVNMNPVILSLPEDNLTGELSLESVQCEPIIEEPATPEQQSTEALESDIEDFGKDPDEIPHIKIDSRELVENVQYYIQQYKERDSSKEIVAWNPESASIPTLKNVSRLRTEHQVYELPDSHPLLEKMDKREPDDPSPYLLAIWTPGETANSTETPERKCGSEDSTSLCNDSTCFSCNSIREANSQTVRGTLLIPCRTATRGSFPLNGTYFQVNEVFADDVSSNQPIDVPRAWIWNLPRRTVYFGTSVTSIFRGLTTQEIQHCFWRGFVCVRGFDQQTRVPRPLMTRLHLKTTERKQE